MDFNHNFEEYKNQKKLKVEILLEHFNQIENRFKKNLHLANSEKNALFNINQDIIKKTEISIKAKNQFNYFLNEPENIDKSIQIENIKHNKFQNFNLQKFEIFYHKSTFLIFHPDKKDKLKLFDKENIFESKENKYLYVKPNLQNKASLISETSRNIKAKNNLKENSSNSNKSSLKIKISKPLKSQQNPKKNQNSEFFNKKFQFCSNFLITFSNEKLTKNDSQHLIKIPIKNKIIINNIELEFPLDYPKNPQLNLTKNDYSNKNNYKNAANLELKNLKTEFNKDKKTFNKGVNTTITNLQKTTFSQFICFRNLISEKLETRNKNSKTYMIPIEASLNKNRTAELSHFEDLSFVNSSHDKIINKIETNKLNLPILKLITAKNNYRIKLNVEKKNLVRTNSFKAFLISSEIVNSFSLRNHVKIKGKQLLN